MSYIPHFIAAMVAAALLLGCSHGDDASIPSDAVARVGKEYLTRDDVNRQLRSGLTPDDSTALAKAYIGSWIDTKLIANVASTEVDIEEIDRLTEEYRNELIMAQYRRAMARQASDGDFAEDSLKEYYNNHLDDFVLERPMLKGIYIKLPDYTSNLATIRRLYNSKKPADIDRLEKAALNSAIHYDYFRDRWVDREQIEKRIPIEFTEAVTASLAAHKPLEVTKDGFVYLLSVDDYLPPRATMPYEAARPIVRERLLTVKRLAYDNQLRTDLYKRAIDNGIAEVY